MTVEHAASPSAGTPTPWSMEDLHDRLVHAEAGLRTLATENRYTAREIRLEAKAEGVHLALSYVEDCLRCGPAAPEPFRGAASDGRTE